MNRYKPVGWRGDSHRHYLAAKGIKTKRPVTKIPWREPKPNEIIEWQKPADFVKRTHRIKIDNVPFSSPHYSDDALGTRPAHELPERLLEAKEVELLKDFRPKAAFMGIDAQGRKMFDGNKCVIDGRHRAWAARMVGDELVPVVVGLKDEEEEKNFANKIKWGTQAGMPIVDNPASFGHAFEKKVVQMSPDDFLKRAGGTVDEQHIDRQQQVLDEDGQFDVPFLEVKDGKVIDHDGRHRAGFAKRHGEKIIPVIIFEDKGKIVK